MRNEFLYNNTINWYPGHMAKALRLLSEKVKGVDMLMEVRDARFPLSTSNHNFDSLFPNKPRLILFNKCDLSDSSKWPKINEYYSKQNISSLFISVKQKININKLIPTMIKTCPSKFKTAGSIFLIVGLTNVGKSSIINSIRKNSNDFKGLKGAKVGATPGLTRNIYPLKINNNPDLYIYDSPGIMIPKLQINNNMNNEVGLNLCLAGCIPDKIVDEDVLCDFILFKLNKLKNYKYRKVLHLSGSEEELDNIDYVLKMISKNEKCDECVASRRFIERFRKGDFGRFVFDEI